MSLGSTSLVHCIKPGMEMGGAGGEKKGDIVAILVQNYAIDKSSELFKHLIKRVFCNL